MIDSESSFRLPRLCLPRHGVDLTKWPVIACDQYTAEPQYWRQVREQVGDALSTLHLIYPEVDLNAPDRTARIGSIQRTMDRYLHEGVFVDHAGTVLVERAIGGRVRRGLMLELDLEQYDFSASSTSPIRPTEGTIVSRLAPRIEIRRGAALELPHVLVLIDDPHRTVIEPIAAERTGLTPLYGCELMQGGGALNGFAVDAAAAQRALAALRALAEPRAFCARYGVPAGTPVLLFAVGDGNHSLATAKSIWQDGKAELGANSPSRHALVEVENIHDSALQFEPIHRLLFGAQIDPRGAFAEAFGARCRCIDMASADAMRQRVQSAHDRGLEALQRSTDRSAGLLVVGLIGPGPRFSVIEFDAPDATLAVAAMQPVLDRWLADGKLDDIDYVHGDDVLERLAVQPGNLGIHLPALGKHELLRRVVTGGPLPRKAFSMGEAQQKRYYFEARRIR